MPRILPDGIDPRIEELQGRDDAISSAEIRERVAAARSCGVPLPQALTISSRIRHRNVTAPL
jgi:hypothetical protein